MTFEDHPQSFGNWRAHFKRGPDFYEVMCDNRVSAVSRPS